MFVKTPSSKGIWRDYWHRSHGEKFDSLEAQTLSVNVIKKYHGTGDSQELINSIEEWFDDEYSTEFEVVEYNSRAIAFYIKYGYTITDDYYSSLGNMMTLKMFRDPKAWLSS